MKWLHLGMEDLGLEPGKILGFFSPSKRTENELTQHVIQK
jgi:hypothetical protein